MKQAFVYEASNTFFVESLIDFVGSPAFAAASPLQRQSLTKTLPDLRWMYV